MRSALYTVVFALILLTEIAGVVRAGDKPVVYWPYFNLPPHFIADGEAPPSGMGIDVVRAVQGELPEYEHVLIQASPQRIMEELHTGRESMVVCGLLKTPEREEYTLYSDIPCRVTFSMTIVMRREDLWRLAPEGRTSLAYLAADQAQTFGYITGVNYGYFSRFVAPLMNNSDQHRTAAAHDVGQLLHMLLEKRIDWFVHDSPGIWYKAGEEGVRDRIALVQATECPAAPIFGYMACSRTKEGVEIMAHINQALARLVESKQLYGILGKWVPNSLHAAFDRAYARRILALPHASEE
ncbi:transporter substrate-binding domain-containing protein [uncultured Pseudodesulfovibrio sp.]|uniref:transporter substrate-binding domain-containing protein n=1 Tax=uncultured Pseudodesulfovibrio sp. TaxID=2035858 RepID=UPI0029C891BE|nr:transporter substrate-binding domain-containing protein [uncultured Pseudodesulfovibrio sp.]